ncbi:aldo/keto reductase [Sphingomonas sp. AR_OL41]|uniref:aldo/keto reductase n=1 Tax=Sphingomonas sp. AR_OL41 TaxID=3042729 RepID=UPI0024806DEE|nr:aldo/keto reductase [Sphingomonas sp. AR_OL41]MDH7971920.1 aldo/keto reductase [Sphingomonas sp. AR_OL41]
MEYRTISPAIPPVSAISLGSWNTFSRCAPGELRTLLARAFDCGINLLDVGYYWDKPDTEDAVADALNGLGTARERYLIAQKLWLWDYPAESFEAQLSRSLARLRTDHVDIVMVSRPTAGLVFEEYVAEVTALIAKGMARAWGVTNFEPEQVRRAAALCDAQGWPRPAMLQMQYNVMRRGVVEGPDYAELFASGDIGLCAAHTMEGGILAGHLMRDRVDPPAFAEGVRPPERNIARDSGGIREEIRARQPRLAALAARIGATPARLAIAFALSHPARATVLIGATRPEQLDDDVAALALVARLPEIKAELDALAIGGVGHPKLFNPHNDI